MQLEKKFKKIVNFKKRTRSFKKLFFKLKNKLLFNSFFSALLRLILSSKFLFKVIYPFLGKRRDIKKINEFWIIRVGFIRKKNYLPFINFDSYLSNSMFCCNLKNLPFENNSCQTIHIKHFFRYFKQKEFRKCIKSFKKRLIPGGMLVIQNELCNNETRFEDLQEILKEENFCIKEIDKSDLIFNGTIKIVAINQNKVKMKSKERKNKKLKDIFEVIKQYKEIFSNKNSVLILDINSEIIKNSLIKIGQITQNIQSIDSFQKLLDLSENQFEGAIIANYLEYINFQEYNRIFKALKRILKPNADILILVPDKTNYISKYTVHLFDKGIFLRILDENNISVQAISLNSSFKMLQTLLKNQASFPIEKNNVKVLLLGIYSMRYTFLSNARWDSQARAFEKLGFQTKIIDLEDEFYGYVINVIKKYNPEILWVGGKEGGAFLNANANFFKGHKYKVVYWLWDIITPKYFDFKNIIDYMFVTSKGEIPLYKKTYNLEKVYYIPVAIMPEILCRNKFIKERYDVGFAGQLNLKNPFYAERTKTLNWIKKNYKVKFTHNIYNYVTEEYQQSKIIFAGDPYFKDLELYASNRPYIALACGSCIITNYFKGLEKLAVNKKHLLWYNNMEELEHLLDEYLSNNTLREEIRQNAEKLAREKHNYVARISNMLDIINQKTEDFYGFL